MIITFPQWGGEAIMKEIRLHGRGGQGAALSAEILVAAFVADGKYASGFPMFGFERRGAPVAAFVRADDQPVREKTQIYFPDCVLVIDPSQIKLPRVYAGLKPAGMVVLNSPTLPQARPDAKISRLGWADATRIALEEIGRPITNTCMLGTFVRTSGWIKIDSILISLENYFEGRLLSLNRKAVQRGFDEAKIEEY